MFASASPHQPGSLCSSQMFYPAVVRDQLDHPQCTPCPSCSAVTAVLPQDFPRIPRSGQGTPLPPLAVSLLAARLFLLTLIKEDLGELFVKGSHSLQLKAKKTTQAYH